MAQPVTDSRQRVLDTALRLFGERGYGGTALQAIADELGFTKASVYYYFRARETCSKLWPIRAWNASRRA